MHYRTIADLNNDVIAWSRRLPERVEIIVGIPRSGLLAANLLALSLNVPFTDVEGLIAGRLFDSGERLGKQRSLLRRNRPRRVLVVDDSLWSGRQMGRVRARIANAKLTHDIVYGAVYIVPEAACLVDTYHSKVPIPRAFEWNIMHHPGLGKSCVTLEGTVLPVATGRAAETVAALHRAEPLFYPTQPIGFLIATQPETARPVIAAWLAMHQICYRTLILIPPAGTAGRNEDDVLRDKAEFYRHSRSWIYIEAKGPDAARLAGGANRPVYCFETRRMFYPGRAGVTNNRPLPGAHCDGTQSLLD